MLVEQKVSHVVSEYRQVKHEYCQHQHEVMLVEQTAPHVISEYRQFKHEYRQDLPVALQDCIDVAKIYLTIREIEMLVISFGVNLYHTVSSCVII